MTNFENIAKLGKYYFPASSHYNNENAIVTCDRCKRTNLSASFGLDGEDLCLTCVDDLTKILDDNKNSINLPLIKVRMRTNMFDEGVVNSQKPQDGAGSKIRSEIKLKRYAMLSRMFRRKTTKKKKSIKKKSIKKTKKITKK
jgi:hypothetical protein